MNRILVCPLALVLAAGCSNLAPPRDAANDAFLVAGKADGGGVAEGTPEARGVLRLVNQASYALLVGEVGVSEEAAENIVAFRSGDDELDGTADDAVFHTLAELDAVPFVGPRAFAALLDWARAHGYVTPAPAPAPSPPAPPVVDPFDPALCDGALMTSAEAAQRLGGLRAAIGTNGVALGPVSLVGRTHDCDINGCGDWAPASSLPLFAEDSSGVTDYTLPLPATGRARVYSAAVVDVDLDSPVVRGDNAALPAMFDCGMGGDYCALRSDRTLYLYQQIFGARVTDSCLRIDGLARSNADGAGRYTETEVVVYGAF